MWSINNEIYYYKDKPYKIFAESSIKLNNKWEKIIIYECQYDNPEGMLWVRLKNDFFELFKPKIDNVF